MLEIIAPFSPALYYNVIIYSQKVPIPNIRHFPDSVYSTGAKIIPRVLSCIACVPCRPAIDIEPEVARLYIHKYLL